jgi:hypothetical protein
MILCVGHVARVENKSLTLVFIFLYGLPKDMNLYCGSGHGFESMLGLQFFSQRVLLKSVFEENTF